MEILDALQRGGMGDKTQGMNVWMTEMDGDEFNTAIEQSQMSSKRQCH